MREFPQQTCITFAQCAVKEEKEELFRSNCTWAWPFSRKSQKSSLPVQTRPIRSRWRRFFEETMLFSVWEVSVAKWHWVISVLTFPPTWCSSTWSPPAPSQESGSVGRTNYEQIVKKIHVKTLSDKNQVLIQLVITYTWLSSGERVNYFQIISKHLKRQLGPPRE